MKTPDSPTEKFAKATECVRDILDSSASDYLMLAIGDQDDLNFSCSGDSDALAIALAQSLIDNPELAKVFTLALAAYAVRSGKAKQISLPDSPTLN